MNNRETEDECSRPFRWGERAAPARRWFQTKSALMLAMLPLGRRLLCGQIGRSLRNARMSAPVEYTNPWRFAPFTEASLGDAVRTDTAGTDPCRHVGVR